LTKIPLIFYQRNPDNPRQPAVRMRQNLGDESSILPPDERSEQLKKQIS